MLETFETAGCYCYSDFLIKTSFMLRQPFTLKSLNPLSIYGDEFSNRAMLKKPSVDDDGDDENENEDDHVICID